MPDQEPGDIIFSLVQVEHRVFRRAGADLLAEIEVTLSEALCGFSRVVIKHLDGRGIQLQHPQPIARVLKPGQVIKVENEGMPYKKSDLKGSLFLVVNVKFPDYKWLEDHQGLHKLKELLPKPEKPISAEVVDEVTYDGNAELEEFGTEEDGGGACWVDEDEADGHTQCAQQ